MKLFRILALCLLPAAAWPQTHDMPGMAMPGMDMSGDAGGSPLMRTAMRTASGTSRNPEAAPMPMLMPSAGAWHLMLMGSAFLVDTQQSGPRGADKLFAPNWFMGAAEHALGGGDILFQSMLSLEPATITERRYPELFQTGETAFGQPLRDAQHPHNFFMSLGLTYSHPLGEQAAAELYYAPVGDPALGPVAFPHRASAADLPQATLGHHWQDSTHIAANVLTGALQYRALRLEASGFYGTEPGEHRWGIDFGPMNSYSARFSVAPAPSWLLQVSAARLARPERQSPGDVVRATASAHYSRPRAGSAWSSSLIWGRNYDRLSRRALNSYAAESLLPLSARDFLTGRAEVVDKDELLAPGVFRIGAWSAGYLRDFPLVPYLQTGLGSVVTAYSMPAALQPYYGRRPWGLQIFLRVRLRPPA